MIRSTCALVLLVCGGLALGACGKKDDAGGSTGSAAASAATTATATATASAAPPADTGAASAAPPADTASAAPPDASGSAAAPPTGAVAQRPIDDCCAALAHQEVAARSKKNRVAAAKAEEICPRVAALVRSGRATRADALNQVRSALVGRAVPGPCR